MENLGLVFTIFMALQGEALFMNLPQEPGLKEVNFFWDDSLVPFVLRGDSWEAVIGIDLDKAPGEYPIDVFLSYEDDQVASLRSMIHVEAKNFRTTELNVSPQYVELSEEDQQRATEEAGEIRAIYSNFSSEPYWVKEFIVPVESATNGTNFGHRRVFNGQPRAPHSGADLRAAKGTEILATNSGKVVLAKNLFFSGNAVFIDHGLGIYSTYLHLSEIMVELGSFVERGQLIGLAGDTGRVTGPHLHWGVRIIGARVDPFSLLKF